MVQVVNPTLWSILACPRCGEDLDPLPDQARCRGCAATFAVRDGVPRLVDDVQGDAQLAAEFEAQHHALPIYLDEASVANRWESLVLPRLADRLGDAAGPILDVGCGIGRFGRAVAERALDLVGLDFQPELLAEAGPGYVGRVEGNILALPFREEAFAGIVSSNTLHHVPDTPAALAELWRILRPGGRLVAWDPRHVEVLERIKHALRHRDAAFTEEHRAFRLPEYRGLLEAAGFEVLSVEPINPVGPLVGAGLDLLRAGRLGISPPIARGLVALDELLERTGASRRLGLMLLAVARKPGPGR